MPRAPIRQVQRLTEEHVGWLARRLSKRPHVNGSVKACGDKLAAAVEGSCAAAGQAGGHLKSAKGGCSFDDRQKMM